MSFRLRKCQVLQVGDDLALHALGDVETGRDVAESTLNVLEEGLRMSVLDSDL